MHPSLKPTHSSCRLASGLLMVLSGVFTTLSASPADLQTITPPRASVSRPQRAAVDLKRIVAGVPADEADAAPSMLARASMPGKPAGVMRSISTRPQASVATPVLSHVRRGEMTESGRETDPQTPVREKSDQDLLAADQAPVAASRVVAPSRERRAPEPVQAAPIRPLLTAADFEALATQAETLQADLHKPIKGTTTAGKSTIANLREELQKFMQSRLAQEAIHGGLYTPVNEVPSIEIKTLLRDYPARPVWACVSGKAFQTAHYDFSHIRGEALYKVRSCIAALIRAANLKNQQETPVCDLVTLVEKEFISNQADKFQVPCAVTVEPQTTIRIYKISDCVGAPCKAGDGTRDRPFIFGKALSYQDMQRSKDDPHVDALRNCMSLFERARSNYGGLFLFITGEDLHQSISALKGGVAAMQSLESAIETGNYTNFLGQQIHRKAAKLFIASLAGCLQKYQEKILEQQDKRTEPLRSGRSVDRTSMESPAGPADKRGRMLAIHPQDSPVGAILKKHTRSRLREKARTKVPPLLEKDSGKPAGH